MPTLNLLNSITPTGLWNTDSIAPYNMQPYDFSLIQTNVVLDAANPILEITNIPVGAMIADPPNDTAPYDSSFIKADNNYEIIFKVIDSVPVIQRFERPEENHVGIIYQQYLEEDNIISGSVEFYVDEILDYSIYYSLDLQLTSIQNGILIGIVNFIGVSSNLLLVNEIASSYSVVSKDPANRKATIRVNGNIDNLKPPLNRLFLNFDKTP